MREARARMGSVGLQEGGDGTRRRGSVEGLAKANFVGFASGLDGLLKARAIRTGSGAMAMAVFTSTAAAPSSMASAAWLGAPSPASTTTGTVH